MFAVSVFLFLGVITLIFMAVFATFGFKSVYFHLWVKDLISESEYKSIINALGGPHRAGRMATGIVFKRLDIAPETYKKIALASSYRNYIKLGKIVFGVIGGFFLIGFIAFLISLFKSGNATL